MYSPYFPPSRLKCCEKYRSMGGVGFVMEDEDLSSARKL